MRRGVVLLRAEPAHAEVHLAPEVRVRAAPRDPAVRVLPVRAATVVRVVRNVKAVHARVSPSTATVRRVRVPVVRVVMVMRRVVVVRVVMPVLHASASSVRSVSNVR